MRFETLASDSLAKAEPVHRSGSTEGEEASSHEVPVTNLQNKNAAIRGKKLNTEGNAINKHMCYLKTFLKNKARNTQNSFMPFVSFTPFLG